VTAVDMAQFLSTAGYQAPALLCDVFPHLVAQVLIWCKAWNWYCYISAPSHPKFDATKLLLLWIRPTVKISIFLQAVHFLCDAVYFGR